ncbi:TPA: hypothetical protein DCW38_02665 [candidate division WOR-3 bacterium]|uniref:DNA 3'-5' helicase n=1 Tax=candidate division WOR-3 bacterium TaxID=2052148 RepID=A0A350H949_UNCW3|nr:hypothetical protein [candidate division WOR-3 bacterium]
MTSLQAPAPRYTLIKAAAGSGKTYRIAKEYIKYILNDPSQVRSILAITFTNKAAAEMKERILLFLKGLSGNTENLTEKRKDSIEDIKKELMKELNVGEAVLKDRARRCVESILYSTESGGYSDFSVMTIDSFTNRLAKVFSNELNIPQNYGIGFNVKNIIRKSIDKLISQADQRNPEGQRIAEILLQYLFYRVEEEKSIAIEDEIFNLTQSLRSMERNFGERIEVPDEFINDFKESIAQRIAENKKIKEDLKSMCEDIKNRCLDFHKTEIIPMEKYYQGMRGFMGALNKYLENQSEENMMRFLSNSYIQKLVAMQLPELLRKSDKQADKDFLTSKGAEYIESQIKRAVKMHEYLSNNISIYFDNSILLKNIYSNLLYESIDGILDKYQRENEILFIDELNSKISSLSADGESVPFIYFRIGEKFRKFMIDEFQDTSGIQWSNLSPLIENAVSEGGDFTGVGDLKQAIYRFRGGSTEVMENLEKSESIGNETLEYNYRSAQNIIELNNTLFGGILHDNNVYSEENVAQKSGKRDMEGFSDNENCGHAEITLINSESDIKVALIDNGLILSIIDDCLKRGYAQSSIGILVRKSEEGSSIAEFLSGKKADGEDLKIVSSDTLFIKENPFVHFIISVMKYAADQSDIESFAKIIYLWKDICKDDNSFAQAQDKFLEITEKKKRPERKDEEIILRILFSDEIYEKLEYRILQTVSRISAYEAISRMLEIIINPLCRDYSQSVMHISKLMNEAYGKMREGGAKDFLDYYDEYGDEMKISSPSNRDAVTISTIHKSKGLEYDIVIIPFATWDGNSKLKDKYFIYEEPKIAVKFGDIKREQENLFRESASSAKREERDKNLFDDINLLYVAMTRAKKELYLYTKAVEIKNDEEPSTVSAIINSRLPIIANESGCNTESNENVTLSIGKKRISAKEDTSETHPVSKITACSHSGDLFIERKMRNLLSKGGREIVAKRGEVLHYLLSKIKSARDSENALNDALIEGIVNADEEKLYREDLVSIMNDKKISFLFEEGWEILNERNIVSEGNITRPDRVMLKGDEAIIADYKTGKESAEHFEQVKKYALAYQKMEYHVKAYIVYTSEMSVKEVEL